MTDTEQLIEKAALTGNCDRRLDKLFDCDVRSDDRPDSQTESNLQAFNSNSGLMNIRGLGAGNISIADEVSNQVNHPCDEISRNKHSSKLSLASAEVEDQGSPSISHPYANMPASLDCIRVLSSTNSMASEDVHRAASARSTRKAKKTRQQAKRFGFWVLSKIFV